MLQSILLFIAVAYIGFITAENKALKKELKKVKRARKAESKAFKNLVKQLVDIASDYRKDAEDYRKAYEECHEAFSDVFVDRHKLNKKVANLKEKLSDIEDLHGRVVNNIHVMLKERRLIKTRYMNTYTTYSDFGELTYEDRVTLFGI